MHDPWLSFPEVLSKDMPRGFMGKVKINTSEKDEFRARQTKGSVQGFLRERLA